ncbi:amino acid ABC transporter permease [Ahrensia sp. R2A130]|uniref:amino acid ABC transporter permease n=1 Tax=Ahrensia sp. R2A130 TaxID=744979 RepID=UPI0001E0F833|nr:ABC transporter permease subunit [Ahrensia sp. R2A130]EFL90475.1 glutamate/glutamine/aspartate/asparagine transport system permease protein BztB [Ahrensia sp. R2A130]
MSVAAELDGPAEPFRLSQLFYDQRYRSITLQIITIAVFMLMVSWLVTNVIQNFEDLGKTFGFDFLWQPASYDINQKLIEYSSVSPHWKAAIVGILNTLVVAFLGCILATIIGVAVGVARLSKNWLVAKLMTVFIEAMRNVPVLLWILLASTVFSSALPSPRQAPVMLGGGFVPTNRGFYVPAPVFNDGSIILGIIFIASIIGAFIFRRWAAARQARTGDILPVFRITMAILILPVFVMFFLLGMPIGLELPELQGFNFQGGLYIRSSFMALWLALSFYTAAFIAENVRAGIQAISNGQSEAAYSLGLPPSRTMNLVILPQALRIIIPPLISQYLNLTKNSSLAIAVGYMDVTGTLGGITLNQTGREMECLLLVMGFYLIISLLISGAMNIYNNSVSLRER